VASGGSGGAALTASFFCPGPVLFHQPSWAMYWFLT
jgi:hypothetical protein